MRTTAVGLTCWLLLVGVRVAGLVYDLLFEKLQLPKPAELRRGKHPTFFNAEYDTWRLANRSTFGVLISLPKARLPRHVKRQCLPRACDSFNYFAACLNSRGFFLVFFAIIEQREGNKLKEGSVCEVRPTLRAAA